MKVQNSVTFEDVAKAASSMLNQGITPSVRGVIAVTGGKTETVSMYLRDFFDKRNAEVIKMADELGSSAIAKLLASEVQNVVDRKTEQLQRIIKEQKDQLNEVIELLSDKEKDCEHRVELAQAKMTQAVNEVNEKITQAKERAERAEEKANQLEITTKTATQKAQEIIEANQSKCDLLINNAKSEADALILAANKHTDKAELEAVSLREQVKALSVEQAKREIEQAQYHHMQETHNKMMSDLAFEKTNNAKLQAQHESKTADIERLNSELTETKTDSKQLTRLQGQLIEVQKQQAQTQHALTQSERERESLTLALRSQK